MTIPSIILDPRNGDELLAQMQATVQTASSNTLNDFRNSSPLNAVLEGLTFGIEELLFYLNLLPSATALEVFRIAGFERSLGSAALGQVQFTLTAVLGSDYVLSSGYLIPFLDTFFRTTEDLVIPAGNLDGLVNVQCDTIGSQYNVPEFGINVNPALNFVDSVTNPSAIVGGADLEELSDTLERLQTKIRNKNVLITATDYALEVQSLLGVGSYAQVFPLLTEDKTTEAPGNVHIFCFGADNLPADVSTLAAIKPQLESKIFAGSQVWLSPGETIEVAIGVNARSENLSSAKAEEIRDALISYLSPNNYGLGATLMTNELVWLTRNISEITGVTSVTIDGQFSNLPMTYAYQKPVVTLIEIDLTNAVGNNAQYAYASGENTSWS